MDNSKRRLTLGLFGMVLLAWVGCSGGGEGDSKDGSGGVNSANLVGTWTRPDGGYILQIRSVNPDGSLNAAYFNPNPIHVGEARWRIAGTVLKAEVTLDDVNYQGSNYTLVYNSETDQLEGVYYQAVARQSFQVFFVRRPAGGG